MENLIFLIMIFLSSEGIEVEYIKTESVKHCEALGKETERLLKSDKYNKFYYNRVIWSCERIPK